MYTFCSFFQEHKISEKISYLRELIDNVPNFLASSN